MYKQLRTKYKIISSGIPIEFSLNLQKMPLLSLIILSVALCFITVSALAQSSMMFSRIAEGGFWKWDDETGSIIEEYEIHNTRPWSMAWFKGKLYVGTGRDILTLKTFSEDFQQIMDPYPVEVPDDPYWHDDGDGEFEEGEGLDTRAQIWRYTPESNMPEKGEWERVYISDWIETLDGTIAREYGYRSMIVFTEPDGTEALYIGTAVPTGSALILRTVTGNPGDFEIASDPSKSLQESAVTFGSIRNLVVFKDKMYITSVSSSEAKSAVYEGTYQSIEGDRFSWKAVSLPGFGDDNNLDLFEMAVFNGFLYVGTLNPEEGYQIWKSDCETIEDPETGLYRWTKVVTNGAYRGPENELVASMDTFTGKDGEEWLYVGGAIDNGGHDIFRGVGPGVAEVIRINRDDNWQLVCGYIPDEPVRVNPETGEEILPISGLYAGFGDFFTGYIWQIETHKDPQTGEDWLYVGTMDNSIFLSYVPPEKMSEGKIKDVILSDPEGPDHAKAVILEETGGFDLWRTQDGVLWYPMTWLGFLNPFNEGIRTLVSTPYGLALGVANEFTSAPVPDGGAQVWLSTEGYVSAPTNLQTNPEANRIKLRWTPSEDAAMYRVIRHDILKPPPEPEIGPPVYRGITTEYFFIDTDVEADQLYAYYVLSDTGTGGVSLIPPIEDMVTPIAQDMFIFTPGSFTFNRVTHQFVQSLTITNNTPQPLMAPVPIVLEGLTPEVTLINQAGKAQNGSPLIYAPQIPGNGDSVTIELRFQNPTFAQIEYIPFVVWGKQEP